MSKNETVEGNITVVVRVLWSTKNRSPVAVYRISNPGGNGPSFIKLTSCNDENKEKLNLFQFKVTIINIFRYLLDPECVDPPIV